jgi:hypothetical protein
MTNRLKLPTPQEAEAGILYIHLKDVNCFVEIKEVYAMLTF